MTAPTVAAPFDKILADFESEAKARFQQHADEFLTQKPKDKDDEHTCQN